MNRSEHLKLTLPDNIKIYLQHDNTLEVFRIHPQRSGIKYLRKGSYEHTPTHLILTTATPASPTFTLMGRHTLASLHGDTYRNITHLPLAETVLLKRCIYLGKQVLLHNRKYQHLVNAPGFGQGTVFHNFNTTPFTI